MAVEWEIAGCRVANAACLRAVEEAPAKWGMAPWVEAVWDAVVRNVEEWADNQPIRNILNNSGFVCIFGESRFCI